MSEDTSVYVEIDGIRVSHDDIAERVANYIEDLGGERTTSGWIGPRRDNPNTLRNVKVCDIARAAATAALWEISKAKAFAGLAAEREADASR